MNTLRAGEVAARAGINVETLRYYERRGLLAEPERSPGGHRRYDQDTVTLLGVVKAAQRLGFTLDEVADLVEVRQHRHQRRRRADPASLQVRGREKLQEVEQRIADLVTIRDNLLAALEAGCDDLVDCAGHERCPIPFVDLAQTPSRPA